MNNVEYDYLNLLTKILDNGVDKSDRTGVGTISLFGQQLDINLKQGFPILTTKKIHFKSVAHELFWMLNGSTNVKDLNKYGVTIWNEWADENGELGPVYGSQWRDWKIKLVSNLEDLPNKVYSVVDQIKQIIDSIENNPDSRRHMVSAWNPAEVDQMKLPPCHLLFQFYVANNALSCHMYQRSADIFLGVPFNIASYALLTHLVAKRTNLDVDRLIVSFGDVHIYKNHFSQVEEQLERKPNKLLPKLHLSYNKDDYPLLFNLDKSFEKKEIFLEGYNPQSAIKAEVAV